MIEWCDCEYNIEYQRFDLVYKLEGQKPEFIEITLAQMHNPYKMNAIFTGLVMLHKKGWKNENI
jgi:hypothetical protein